MRKGTPSFPAPANFKNTDHPLTPHLPSSPFLFKREPAQGQGLTGAGTPRDEFLRGFIFVPWVVFLSHAGAAEGWGVYSPAPSHCTVSLP